MMWNLKNVYVILIMPFDPLGQNRMLYTARTLIEEDISIPYDDGARTMFFYTNGDPANVPEAVRQLLKYLEQTTSENAGNDVLREIDQMVNFIRHDEIVEDIYMKSWEHDEWMRDQGREIEKGNTEKERQRADAAEKRICEMEAELSARDAALADKDTALADKDTALADKNDALADKDAALADKDAILSSLQNEIFALKAQIAVLSGGATST